MERTGRAAYVQIYFSTGYCLIKLQSQIMSQRDERYCDPIPGAPRRPCHSSISFGVLVSKGWEHQVLKMSLSTDLLPDLISNRCWNSPLLGAVLECRGLGPLHSNS